MHKKQHFYALFSIFYHFSRTNSFFLALMSVHSRVDILQQFVVIGGEGEGVSQHRVVLAVGAVVVCELEELEAFVIEGEDGRHALQIAHTERAKRHTQFGYFQTLVVESLFLQSFHDELHLLGFCTTRTSFFDPFPMRRLGLLRVGWTRLRTCDQSYNAHQCYQNLSFHTIKL